MLEIVTEETKKGKIVQMKDMKPLEIGVIVDHEPSYAGTYVMRTASTKKFEVMNLSKPGPDKCSDSDARWEARLLEPGEEIKLRLFNEGE